MRRYAILIITVVFTLFTNVMVFGRQDFTINVVIQRPAIFKNSSSDLREMKPHAGSDIRWVPASNQLVEIYQDHWLEPKLIGTAYTDENGKLDNLPFSSGDDLPERIKIVVRGASSLGFNVGITSDLPHQFLEVVWDYKWQGTWVSVNSNEVNYPPQYIGISKNYLEQDFKAASLFELLSFIYQELDLSIDSKWNISSRYAEYGGSTQPWAYWDVVHMNANITGHTILYQAPHELGHIVYNYYHSDKTHYDTDDWMDYAHPHNACTETFGQHFANYEGYAHAFRSLFWCYHAQRLGEPDYAAPGPVCPTDNGFKREGTVNKFYSFAFAGKPMRRPPGSLDNWTTQEIGANKYAFPPIKSFFTIGKKLSTGYHLENVSDIWDSVMHVPDFLQSPEGVPTYWESRRFKCLVKNSMLSSDDSFPSEFFNVDCTPGISTIANVQYQYLNPDTVIVEFTPAEPVDKYYIVVTPETGSETNTLVDLSNQDLLNNLQQKVSVPLFDSYHVRVETEYSGDFEEGPAIQLQGIGYQVNTTEDVDDGNCDDGHCSLREAINAANMDSRKNVIHFDIPGVGNSHTIQPLSPLPVITDPVIIDGITQPGYYGTPLIIIDGSNAGSSDGLVITADNCIIKELRIILFSSSGIVIQGGNNNTISGNYIGNSGYSPKPNNNGINIVDGASGNIIGGTDLGTANVISGNLDSGVGILRGATGNLVQGNFIGTNKSGSSDIPNADGIWLGEDAADNIIGGYSSEARNVISGNNVFGVSLNHTGTTGNLVAGNYIGTDVSGAAPLPNNAGGVVLTSGTNNNSIGGTLASGGNLIAFNEGPGIKTHDDAGNGNAFLFNSIHSNAGLGIDLLDDWVTPNDFLDSDTGPNNKQNYPVLSNAKSGYTYENIFPEIYTTVDVSLNSIPENQFLIQLFNNGESDPSGYGEGEIYLTNFMIYTDSDGEGNMTDVLIDAIPGEYITATARDAENNSSEFSQCITVEMSLAELSTTVAQDETESSETTLAAGMSSATFSSQWPGSDVEMTLIAPSGRVITRNTLADDVTHENGSTYEYYTVTYPEPGNWTVELYGADVEADGEEVTLSVTGAPTEPMQTMVIDIKPNNENNSVNCKSSNGVVPVAILTTDDFDATSIDHTTVRFGRFGSEAGETHVKKKSGKITRHEEDVDNDGDIDLVFHFRFNETGLDCDDEFAVMLASDYDGQLFTGSDIINMKGRNKLPKSFDGFSAEIPVEFALSQNYPNPFNPSTVIRYALPEASFVKLEVYSSLGQLVSVLVNNYMSPGYHEANFDALNLPSGIYLYRIETSTGFMQTKKLMLLK